MQYVHWTDNKGGSGWLPKNTFHSQSYYPKWIKGDKLTFRGTRLPQNARDQSGVGRYYVLFKFRYGYVDNEKNDLVDSAIDIDWAIDKYGRKVHLPGIDFIRIHTGDQPSQWLARANARPKSQGSMTCASSRRTSPLDRQGKPKFTIT